MTIKRIFIVIMLAFVSFCYAGCTDLSLPVYEKTDEDYVSVIIDGVRYKEFPSIKWSVESSQTTIGYTSGREEYLVEAKDDYDNNFIFIVERVSSLPGKLLYRADKEIPEPSNDSVFKIHCDEAIFKEEEAIYKENITNDKETIRELFDVISTGVKIKEVTYINDYSISINCYSDKVHGAHYKLQIAEYNNKLMCGEPGSYVEMPIDLLEKIAGHKIDLEYILQE